jgi:pimeloyl-ACP methyl ester carboxylesterase
MSASEKVVCTSHAEIAYRESSGRGLPVLLIHGNSTCKEVFSDLIDGPIGETYRMIAIDLPGHGKSGNARDPARTYSLPGYAACAVEVLDTLGISQAAVYGWSLGGHIALEMIPHFPGVLGVMISSAPPVRPGLLGMLVGFRMMSDLRLFSKETLTSQEQERCAKTVFGNRRSGAFAHALWRADGRARRLLARSMMAGRAADERWIAEHSPVPIAIVNGADDPLVNMRYVSRLSYRNLWDNHCYLLRGVGHAPFLEAPQAFNPIFERFLADIAARAASRPAPAVSGLAVA